MATQTTATNAAATLTPIRDTPHHLVSLLAQVPGAGFNNPFTGMWIPFSEIRHQNVDENFKLYAESVAFNMCCYHPCVVKSFITDAIRANSMRKGYWICCENVEFWHNLCAQENKIVAPCMDAKKETHEFTNPGGGCASKQIRVSPESAPLNQPQETMEASVPAISKTDDEKEGASDVDDEALSQSSTPKKMAPRNLASGNTPRSTPSYLQVFSAAAVYSSTKHAESSSREDQTSTKMSQRATRTTRKCSGITKKAKTTRTASKSVRKPKAAKKSGVSVRRKNESPWKIIKQSPTRRRGRKSQVLSKASPKPAAVRQPLAKALNQSVKSEHENVDKHISIPAPETPDSTETTEPGDQKSEQIPPNVEPAPSVASTTTKSDSVHSSPKRRSQMTKRVKMEKEHVTVMYVRQHGLMLREMFINVPKGQDPDDKLFMDVYDKAKTKNPSAGIVCIVIARRFHFFQFRSDAATDTSPVDQSSLLIKIKYKAEECAQKWVDHMSYTADPLAIQTNTGVATKHHHKIVSKEIVRDKAHWHEAYASIAMYILYNHLDIVNRGHASALNSVVAFLSNQFSSHKTFYVQFRANMFKLFMLRPGAQVVVATLCTWIYACYEKMGRLKLIVQVLHAAKSLLELPSTGPSGDDADRLCAQGALSLLSCFGSLGQVVDYWTSTRDSRSATEWSKIVALLHDSVLDAKVQNYFFASAQRLQSKSCEKRTSATALGGTAIMEELIKRYLAVSISALISIQLSDTRSDVLRAKLRAQIHRLKSSRRTTSVIHCTQKEDVQDTPGLMRSVVLNLMTGEDLPVVTLEPTRMGSLFVSWCAKMIRKGITLKQVHSKTYASVLYRLIRGVAGAFVSFARKKIALSLHSENSIAQHCGKIECVCSKYIRGAQGGVGADPGFDESVFKLFREMLGIRQPQRAQSAPTSPKN